MEDIEGLTGTLEPEGADNLSLGRIPGARKVEPPQDCGGIGEKSKLYQAGGGGIDVPAGIPAHTVNPHSNPSRAAEGQLQLECRVAPTADGAGSSRQRG